MTKKEIESTPTEKCKWCGNNHNGIKCYLVKSIEYLDVYGGEIKKIEFFSPSELHINYGGAAAGPYYYGPNVTPSPFTPYNVSYATGGNPQLLNERN